MLQLKGIQAQGVPSYSGEDQASVQDWMIPSHIMESSLLSLLLQMVILSEIPSQMHLE